MSLSVLKDLKDNPIDMTELRRNFAILKNLVLPEIWSSHGIGGVHFCINLPQEVGIKGVLDIPFAATITRARLLHAAEPMANMSAVVDIWKSVYADYEDISDAASICASAKPTITNQKKWESTALTGWTTAIAAGDCLVFNLDSYDEGAERLLISLWFNINEEA